MKKPFFLALVMILGVTAPSLVTATPITFSAASASGNLAASVEFEVVGGNLQVTLTNTSTADVLVQSDVLTAVFFTIAGDPTLTRVSARLVSGSTVLFAPAGGSGPDVGGEWAYKDGLVGAPLGADEGISSSGLSLFGPGDRFDPASNLQGPPSGSLNAIEYGITSAGDNTATQNKAVTGDNALIQNSVVFLLGLPSGFDPSTLEITDVSFQYGTSLSEPNLAVPEPATMFLLGSGLIGVGVFVRRRFKK